MTTKSKRVYRRLDDRMIEAMGDFVEGPADVRIVWDDRLRGLQVRVGVKRITFSYFAEFRLHGRRGTVCKRLGFAPLMKIAEARRLASIEAGRVASGRVMPGRAQAMKVADALDAYLDHLTAQATRRGKPDRWRRTAQSIAKCHIRPEFDGWTLNELAAAPAALATWHRKVTKASGAVVANRAAKIVRASYKRAARLDRSLPPHNPISAVEMNAEGRSQKALAFADFPRWREAWDRIASPTRKAFQMINLLSGARPGELSRLRWADVLPRERCFVLRASKTGGDVRVVLSAAIVRELRRARDADVESPYVFPDANMREGHLTKFEDGLPAHGIMLRRTWRTVAADIGVDELIAHFLLGHIPAGISRGYVSKLILTTGSGMRRAQREISANIMRRLGLDCSRV
jgi:integrase